MRNVSLPRSCTLLHLFILQIAISLLCRFLLSVTTQLQLLLLFAALTCRRSASLWFRIVAEYWLPARRLSLIWLIFYCRFAYARTLQVEVSGTYKYLLLYLLWQLRSASCDAILSNKKVGQYCAAARVVPQARIQIKCLQVQLHYVRFTCVCVQQLNFAQNLRV